MAKKNSKKTKEISFFSKHKRKIIISAAILILATIIGAGIYSTALKNQAEAKAKKEAALAQDSVLLFEVEGDFVLGSKDAPLTIVEYASLSCPHCANFYNEVFGKIKEQYIDTGKVKFIYRDFPLNQSALLASIVAHCHAQNNGNDTKKYYNFIKVLFKTQESWAFSENFFEQLRSIAKLDGMSPKQFDKCSQDQKIVEEILARRLKASKELTIDSTPTFIINGKKFANNHAFEKFKEVIDNELKILQK